MTIETYDGVGNRWDAEGRLIQRATGPFAAEGELYERPSPIAKEEDLCSWAFDGQCEKYDTSCGQAFVLEDGTPESNEMKFCCYCGKELIELAREPCWSEDEEENEP